MKCKKYVHENICEDNDMEWEYCPWCGFKLSEHVPMTEKEKDAMWKEHVEVLIETLQKGVI